LERHRLAYPLFGNDFLLFRIEDLDAVFVDRAGDNIILKIGSLCKFYVPTISDWLAPSSQLIEAKFADDAPARSLLYFKERFGTPKAVQLVQQLRKATRQGGVDVVQAADWFSRLDA
jgi:hypothetical protein